MVAYLVGKSLAMHLYRLIQLGNSQGDIVHDRPKLIARIAGQPLRHGRDNRVVEIVIAILFKGRDRRQ